MAKIGLTVSLVSAALAALGTAAASDPCAAIAGKKWVAPKDVRACFTSFQVDPEIKANVSYWYPQYLVLFLTRTLDCRGRQQDVGVPYLRKL